MVQQHLTYNEMTDYGCFYTPQPFIDNLINMIETNVLHPDEYTYLDSSCGYGSFLKSLRGYKTIGCDIDEKAVYVAERESPESRLFVLNSLFEFNRGSIRVDDDEKLIVIGNPPYNDVTSRVKNEIKKAEPCKIDEDLKTRDLGISFLLSFNKLKADYVAVLHPLSYLIKKANYELLKPFFNNYKLIDHTVVNSQRFSMTSKTKGFPIIAALYMRNGEGTSYDEVLNMTFRTIDNERFDLKHDYIRNYIRKYPAKNQIYKDGDILFFTMRDINALNRSKTFIEEMSDNAIIVDKRRIEYYCYVDVFKDYIIKLPYYFGNCDVFIDNDAFCRLKDIFITKSVEKHPWLNNRISFVHNNNFRMIDLYFDKLFNF